ncbi:MAG: UDP-N-acetylglucosamine 2-epimerase (non-hydrolyzing) [Lentisphaerae bacterium]|nr:UDP-N-acetylglucosamine 2-epimerase (non-hydrolyzing) [Lentisphaerota bacterium]MCP4100699.1 UDP-N-acetylglucosamine 2-epimerase (non-hydrolyzing) [Lentisphaerota bacterium]
MKKIITVAGARPNFMKIAPIDRAFKNFAPEYEHLIVHTGQHYDDIMSKSFFKILDISEPAYHLNVGSGSHAVQTAKVMIEFEKVCIEEKPDLVIVVGDVNSTVACAITAKKLHIPVAHIEAGLRSFDMAMPEEINRKITDSISNIAFLTEPSGKANLLKEGWESKNMHLVGNTMIDSLCYIMPQLEKSDILEKLNLSEPFAILTMHRPSNVDDREQLTSLVNILEQTAKKINLVFPIHPRTKAKINEFGLSKFLEVNGITFCDALNYLDFMTLLNNSKFVLTDSGGIQEEAAFLRKPCVTLRENTERPITCKTGSNILVGNDSDKIINAVNNAISSDGNNIAAVSDLWDGKAAERIVKIIIDMENNL